MPSNPAIIPSLCCPKCLSVLWGSQETKPPEWLTCSCGESYPCINGIPRVFPDGLPQTIRHYHGQFFSQHQATETRKEENRWKKRTSEAFGFEWTEFPHYHADNYEKMLGPAIEIPLAGKVCLEVGCGAGRHAIRSAERGATVVAIDYSLAIESAAQNTKANASISLVQCDVFALPFQLRTFDCAYSLGVLHHTQDPEEAFRQVASRVKPGGYIFIWVYKRTLRKLLFEPFRKPFTYIPGPLLKKICFLAAALDYGVFCQAYRALNRLGWPGRFLARLMPNRVAEYAKYDFSVSYTDWYDRLSAPIVNIYSEADINGWFRRLGLEEIVVSSQADFGVRAQGRIPG